MFTHRGESRTFKHNLRIASLLSFVAGIVNVAGFLAVHRLTTNVTGHFAFFVDEVFQLRFFEAFLYFLFTFFFFLGSFISNLLVESLLRWNAKFVYLFPAIIEAVILFVVALTGQWMIASQPDLLACLLLFAMGWQNSLVTTISNATVRTTHLTGLFTDLGIELSQLFYSERSTRSGLYSSIRLRLTIITFFFVGGVAAGLIYSVIQLEVLAAAAIALMSGIILDYWGMTKK